LIGFDVMTIKNRLLFFNNSIDSIDIDNFIHSLVFQEASSLMA